MTIEQEIKDIIFNLDTFAEPMVYWPATGSNVTVLEGIKRAGQEQAEEGGKTVDYYTVWVMADDVTSPQHRDIIRIKMPSGGYEDWYVERIEGGNPMVWQLTCYQEKRPRL